MCGVYRYLKQYGTFGDVPTTVHVDTALAEAQEAGHDTPPLFSCHLRVSIGMSWVAAVTKR